MQQARGHPDRAPTRAVRRAQHAICSAWPRSSIRDRPIFITAGRKAAQFVARTQRSWPRSSPTAIRRRFAEARAIATFARDLFLKGEVDQVRIVATRFRQHADPEAGRRSSTCRSARSQALQLPGRGEADGAARRTPTESLFEPGAGGGARLSARPLSQLLRLSRAARTPRPASTARAWWR